MGSDSLLQLGQTVQSGSLLSDSLSIKQSESNPLIDRNNYNGEQRNKAKLKSLNSVRFFLALMIVLHHFNFDGVHPFTSFGPFSVTIFFILSGFCLSIGYGDKVLSNKFIFKDYIKRRCFKIYPIHIITFILAIAIPTYMAIRNGNINLHQIVIYFLNLCLLQSWVPIERVYFSGNAVSWFLCDILFLYICFPFLYKALSKNLKNKAIYIGLLIFGYIVICFMIPGQYQHHIIYVNPLFRLMDFTLGIVLFKLYSHFYDKKDICLWNPNIAETAILAINVLVILCFAYIPQCLSFDALFIPCGLFTIFVLVYDERHKCGYLLRLLTNKSICYLGSLSMEIYMIQLIVMQWLDTILRKLNMQLNWEFRIIPYILLIIFASYILRWFLLKINKSLHL